MKDINIAELTYAHWRAEEEKEIERIIVKAREYHDGEQLICLSDRLREFLNVTEDSEFNMNIVRGVVEAITEKLMVLGFKCGDDASAEFAWDVWTSNGMDAKQVDMHDMVIRDREAFVFVTIDEATGKPRLIPHQRYTSAEVDGDNEGCKATYLNDDPNQELLYISKRWVETIDGKSHSRMTVYHPDRTEKYMLVGEVFVPIDDETMEREGDSEWPIPWVDAAGQPLGIPAAHFMNQGLRQEAKDAWPLQDASNKTLIDMLASADVSSYPVYTAMGFVPTTDGKPLASDQSNALTISPGMIISSQKQDASFDALPGNSPAPLIEMLQQLIYYSAIVTRTPVSRYQFSGMVAAEGTLKQQNESLLAKVMLRQISFGAEWAKVMMIARHLNNVFGAGMQYDETQSIETLWRNPESRDRLQELQALQIEKDTLNVPIKMLWRKAGYNDQDIEQMTEDREEELLMNLRVSQADLSSPLVDGAQDVT